MLLKCSDAFHSSVATVGITLLTALEEIKDMC